MYEFVFENKKIINISKFYDFIEENYKRGYSITAFIKELCKDIDEHYTVDETIRYYELNHLDTKSDRPECIAYSTELINNNIIISF